MDTTPKRPARRIGEKTKTRRGFAAMTPELHRSLSSAGGQAVHASGVAHRWTSETAREAGRKGGSVSRRGPAKKK